MVTPVPSAPDQTSCHVDSSLKKEDFIASGKHVLSAHAMKSKDGYAYLAAQRFSLQDLPQV